VLRAISSSLISLLLVATMLWGGCVSCPQFFMFPKVEKSCCNKAGQCERPSKSAPAKECKRMPFEFQGYSVHVEWAVSILTTDRLGLIPPAIHVVLVNHFETSELAPSPPDLNVVNSTFLI
jgi:hypothetical protein